MGARIRVFFGILLVGWWSPAVGAQPASAAAGPQTEVYRSVGGVDLKAHVFRPPRAACAEQCPAMVLFHGGGWYMGEAEWMFARARRYAELGMVAVAAQYRLSDQKSVTPLEAMADARAVIRWMRSHAARLGIRTDRIAALGISSGGHLAASAAIFSDPEEKDAVSAAPSALILISPALRLESDTWPQRLLGARATAASISPVTHVRKGLPPTLILQGDVDTVTPLAGAQLFCERMTAAGNRCDLLVYRGYGHLFTPAGVPDDGTPEPDPRVSAEAARKGEAFLVSLGFIALPPPESLKPPQP